MAAKFIIPTGFDKATGVVEGRCKCKQPDCNRIFPVTDTKSNKSIQCPYCRSTNVQVLTISNEPSD